MEEYLPAGEMITGNIAGKGVSGTTSGFITRNFEITGAPGKKTSIGKSSTLGAFRAGNPIHMV